MQLKFYKYQGTGNDFVLVNNLDGQLKGLPEKAIKHICDRRFGVGADGFMILGQKDGYDFEMLYYNADGREGSMCGNGGRCITMFAHDMGIKKPHYHFIAADGPHNAYIDDKGIVSLKMKNVKHIEKQNHHYVLDTGSPHYVVEKEQVMHLNVFEEGRKIRYSPEFKNQGINVNFVEVNNDGSLIVRTYERGVEDETFSCGTGVTAAALVFPHHELGFNSIPIKTLGGHITVEYERNADGTHQNIWLKGPAMAAFEGVIEL